jgi:N-acetylglucosamine-6-phosphate deacetylase
METCQLKVYNGKVITPEGIVDGATTLVDGGKVFSIHKGNTPVKGRVEIDAKGDYVSPGFIDIHIHGGGGHDFMDNTLDAFFGIARLHAQHGTTSMCPTTLTSEIEDLYRTIEIYEQARNSKNAGAKFMGLHLEGPYLAMNQRGAQDPRFIRNFDEKEYKNVVARSDQIIRWSAAPELPGAARFGDFIRSKNIMPAIAHSDATYEEVVAAMPSGFTHVTHFYSAMSGVTRKNAMRFAGIIESTYLLDELTTEIIADGVHLPAPLLKLVFKIKGPDKVALITDSMRAAGMPPGESVLGGLKNGLKVIVEDDVAKLPDRSSFAGSVATADRLVRNMITLAEISLVDAIRMMTRTPATIMGFVDRKGTLEKGKDADIVIFDKDINVKATIVEGEVIHQAGR